ncbi:MAG: hypothetical protein OZSIB_1097 [Candidatus Ozemobacter sibiricus]|jgi:tetratricopeptide (TPR) repeat protein|uniref:Tetratricopeptide repeat protein n=1 Tax=Candidatus Ozemobacter sibiricus TaxID=2268124 RepID=A0A367ZKX4_9BACT|nr:MAG: hypothetical protein OZSIB_1097 [Candidatus Ozemobacter sibiricus]
MNGQERGSQNRWWPWHGQAWRLGGLRRAGVVVLLVVGCLPSLAAAEETPRAALRKAQSLYAQKKYAEAVEILEDGVKRFPDFHPLWALYGFALLEIEEPEEAQAAFRQALATGRELPPLVRLLLEARLAEAEKRVADGGPELAARREAERKQMARSLFLRALRERGEGKREAALETFVACVELDASYLSNDYGFIGEGLAFYGPRARRGPREAFFHAVYQRLYGNLEEARRLLQAVVDQAAAPPDLRERARRHLAEIKEALARIAEAAQPVPAPMASPTAKPVTLTASTARAVAAVADVPGSEPSRTSSEPPPPAAEPTAADRVAAAEVAEILAQARALRASRPVAAINLYAAAMRKQPDPQALLELGDLYLEEDPKGNLAEAVQTFQKITTRYPDSAQARQAKARLLSLQPPTDERARQVEEHFQQVGTDHLDQEAPE